MATKSNRFALPMGCEFALVAEELVVVQGKNWRVGVSKRRADARNSRYDRNTSGEETGRGRARARYSSLPDPVALTGTGEQHEGGTMLMGSR